MSAVNRVNTATWSRLFHLICELKQDQGSIETISFNSNKLRTLFPIVKLPELLPSILNLSFADNQLIALNSIEYVLTKLKHLRELVLIGNPIATSTSGEKQNELYRK